MNASRCRYCGKPAHEHQARTANCPGGRKHRVHGWPWFHPAQVFEPKLRADKKETGRC